MRICLLGTAENTSNSNLHTRCVRPKGSQDQCYDQHEGGVSTKADACLRQLIS